MRYALLVYTNADIRAETTEEDQRRTDAAIAAVLDRPDITGWLRLKDTASATTVSSTGAKTLLTDGPFVDSKDFLAGLIVVEADDLDGALSVAGQLQDLRSAGAIEVRPVREEPLVGA